MTYRTLLLAAAVLAGPTVIASAAYAEGNNLAAVERPAGTGVYETIHYGATPSDSGKQAAMDATSLMAENRDTLSQPRR